jgi:isoquinoline 1-oxidoreductase beta subunit
MPKARRFNRRCFLVSAAAAGGGLALGFAIPCRPDLVRAGGGPQEITAWIVIQPDDAVVIRVARSEMGQGISTALPMLVAEELECDWSKVRVEFPSPDENYRRNRIWGDFSTGGSRSVRNSQAAMRKAGATARAMLIAAAAKRWEAAASECAVRNGVITHLPTGRSVRFGQVAATAAAIESPRSVTLKPPRDWTIAGKPTKPLDAVDKVRGAPIFGIDVRLPGMLHAALAQCPVFHGTLKSVDDTRIAARAGVHRVIRFEDAVAVVADNWWQAKTAIDALGIIWNEGSYATVSSRSIDDDLLAGLSARDAGVGRSQGDLSAGLARAVRRIEADYSAPFLAHATLEPQNCTAHVTGNRAEIWVPTQNGEAALATAASTLNIPAANITVHKTMLGGGFGRRGAIQDFVPHAVLIAREMGRPVKTVWSRAEDMRHDHYRPVAMARMTAGLDADGMPVAWHVRMTGPSIRGGLMPLAVAGRVDKHFQQGFLDDMPYDVQAYLADYAMCHTHVPVGFWRSVNHSQNCFFKESFIDELAHAAGTDPYRYRRRLIGGHPHARRFLGVLDAAAKQAGWDRPAPAGLFRGIALNESQGTYVAAVAEISVGEGRAHMHRIVMAVDPGTVVNPLTVEMQTEGAVVFGLTAALYGEITIKDGRVEQSNFDNYRVLRMNEMPKVETIVMPSGGFWGGVGEPPVAVVAPALSNAVFAATGKRVRSLPLRNHDLRST